MEVKEDIVIVGGGIAGLSLALSLHRLGLKSLVLESSDSLRVTGVAFTTWTNAWKVLDALGVGESLRHQHCQQLGIVVSSTNSGARISEVSFLTKGTRGDHEVRCLKRRVLLETLANELPNGTIRYSSKVVSIEDSGYSKLVQLSDGTILRTKVLIGCDGVNSVVSRWLGFKKPSFAGRSAIRGYAEYKDGHGFEPKFMQFVGNGVRYGIVPCDDTSLYWFFTLIPSDQDKEIEENPAKMKQFVLNNLGNVPDQVTSVFENTKLEDIVYSALRFRPPWQLLWGNIRKDNICVIGDAFHPMTPDLGQGACSAMEDALILARCLAKALLAKPGDNETEKLLKEQDEHERIKIALGKYAGMRRWRAFDIVSTAYVVGSLQQAKGMVLGFVRDRILGSYMASLFLKKSDFDVGKLVV